MKYRLKYYNDLPLTLEEAIYRTLAVNAEGRLESVEEDAENNRKLLVKLIVLLADKEVLSPSDCLSLLGPHWSTAEEKV